MKLTARNVHRDIAYFYLGLIISFSLSGIFLNHRALWNPSTYVYQSEEVSVKLPEKKEDINEEFVKGLSKEWGLESSFRGFRLEKEQLRITYNEDRVEIDLKSGKGKKEAFRKTPLLAQIVTLHKDTSNFWIYYSDVFGLGMLIIAFTGMFIANGKYSYTKRGWILSLIGIIFPLIFLFLLS